MNFVQKDNKSTYDILPRFISTLRVGLTRQTMKSTCMSENQTL
jgi:hypothetical protein